MAGRLAPERRVGDEAGTLARDVRVVDTLGILTKINAESSSVTPPMSYPLGDSWHYEYNTHHWIVRPFHARRSGRAGSCVCSGRHRQS